MILVLPARSNHLSKVHAARGDRSVMLVQHARSSLDNIEHADNGERSWILLQPAKLSSVSECALFVSGPMSEIFVQKLASRTARQGHGAGGETVEALVQ